MRKFKVIVATAGVFGLASCGAAGPSTIEVRQAAIEHARQELGIDASVPLEGTVWTGREWEGDLTYCGTVSSQDGAANQIVPHRFMAVGDPLQFRVFEPAHKPMVTSQPGMFASWEQVCAGAQTT